MDEKETNKTKEGASFGSELDNYRSQKSQGQPLSHQGYMSHHARDFSIGWKPLQIKNSSMSDVVLKFKI